MSIGNRLNLVIEYYNMTHNSFAKSLGMHNGSNIKRLITLNRTPQISTVNKISEAYPNLNMDWLRTGSGQMISNLPESLSDNDDLTVTAKQIINQLDINSLHYTAMLEKKLSDDREHYNSVTEYNTDNHSKHISSLLKGYKTLENRLETKLQEVEAGVTKQILKKLAEDREYYSTDATTAQNIINILDGFKTLERRVESYALAASSKVVDNMAKAIAKQNKLLLEGYEKITSLENELEDIKMFMATNFELDKMNKEKSKQIKRLNPKD